MTGTDSVDVTYCGPHAKVQVVDYDTGFETTVERGHTLSAPADAAKSLLDQGADHWVAVAELVPLDRIRTHAQADAAAHAAGYTFQADTPTVAQKVAELAEATHDRKED